MPVLTDIIEFYSTLGRCCYNLWISRQRACFCVELWYPMVSYGFYSFYGFSMDSTSKSHFYGWNPGFADAHFRPNGQSPYLGLPHLANAELLSWTPIIGINKNCICYHSKCVYDPKPLNLTPEPLSKSLKSSALHRRCCNARARSSLHRHPRPPWAKGCRWAYMRRSGHSECQSDW